MTAIGNFFFKYRSYTPLPLAVAILYFARPALPGVLGGCLLLILGEAVRLNAVRYAGSPTRTTRVGAPALCTAGPYAHVRNPLYLGNMLNYTGLVLVAGAPAVELMLAVTWIFFTIQYGLIIALEEETLANKFGESYHNYRRNVPRLLPRLTAWTGAEPQAPQSLGEVLKTEKRTLQNIALFMILILIRVYLF